MIESLICIDCPNGCKLTVEVNGETLKVEGNRCKRGVSFAENEIFRPVRTISSTVKTTFKSVPVLPVRTGAPFDKARIFDVMKEINKIVISTPVKRGDVIIKNVLGLNTDVIAASGILEEI